MTATLTTGVVSVLPGPPVLIGSPLQAGTLIVNTDDTNGVWISDQPGVQPGYGFLLDVAGSLTWQESRPCYAVVDTGVTKAVSLAVGGAATNLQNPVAVATALAIAGIPNTLLFDTLFSGNVGGGGVVPISDVSKYATVIILSDTTAGGGVGPSFTYQWQDSNGNALFSDAMSSLKDTPPAYATIELSVIAPRLKITNNNGITQSFVVYGTNRATDGVQVPTFNRVSAFSTGSIAWTAGETVALNSVGGGPSEGQSRYDGLCSMTVTLTGTAVANVLGGELSMIDADSSNAIVIMDGSEFHAVAGHARCYKQFIHPRTPMSWLWISQTAFTYNISIAITGS